MKSPHQQNRAQQLAQMDKACLWHPFTPMRQWIAGELMIIEAAEGFELIDAQGRRYIDGFSSLWCNLHGHRVPAIDRAIREQLDRVAHSTLLGFGSAASIEAARRLVEITPAGLAKVFFSDSGASAVEVALKMAFQYYANLGQPRRRRFLALREGYHGDTVGAMSVGAVEVFHERFRSLLFDVTFVDTPNPYHNPAGDVTGQAVLKQIDEALAAAPGEYCAVILEPLIQGAAGMLTQPPGFLSSLSELTRRHDVLLIADEVATGFCRTGKLFACEHENVTPDLMCLGKGLTGGYLPVAATMATKEIFDAFCGKVDEGRTFYHGHTFTGNALGCAAATASMDLISRTGLLDRLGDKVRLIARRLGELAEHPNVGDIRQCGMMAGVELVARRGSGGAGGQRHRSSDEAFPPQQRVGSAVCARARKFGLIIRPLGDVVVLMPAPAMDLKTLDRMMCATVETVKEYFKA